MTKKNLKNTSTSNLKSPFYIKRTNNGIIQTKKLSKPIVYVRTYDLRNKSIKILKSVGLEQAIYIYVGSTKKPYISHRNYTIKQNYETKKMIHKDYLSFLDKYDKLLDTLNLDIKDKDNLMFKCSSVKYVCNTKKEAYKIEKCLSGQYKWLQSFNDISEYNTYLLSDTDCIFKEIAKEGVSTLKLK